MNMAKLRGKMRELSITQEEMAKMLGIALSTFNRKILGVGNSVFTVEEAIKIKGILNLTTDETMAIFFADAVSEVGLTSEKVS